MNKASSSEAQLSEKRQKLLALMRENEQLARKLLDRILPRTTSEPPPLSFAQQRQWFLNQLAPGSPFYNIPAAMRIRASINAEILRATFNEIIRRHEVLRTAFSEVDGKPFQLILPEVDIPLQTVDLRHLPPAAREREAVRVVEEHARTPFDLHQVPLIRLGLVCLDDSDFVFLITLHHIVADGWSMGVLSDEFRQIYTAFAQGLPSPLPRLPIQYADFAAWQEQRIAGGYFQNQFHYWMKKLAGLPRLELPTDFPHPAVQGFEGESFYVTLPLALTEELKQFSRSRNTTLFVTLYAAFNALLHRYTGQDDIVIGEPIANRNRAELEPLIGFFANSIVLRTDVSGDPTFAELLRRSREVVLEALANQEVPFEVLVERLKPERSLGRNPLFQVSLQFFSGAKSQYASLSRDAIVVEKGTAGLDLAFDLIDSEAGLVIRVEYSTELFRNETVRRMVSHYQNLLEAFVQNPNLPISKAPMLSPAETHQLKIWSSSSAVEHPPACVHDLFEAQVAATPNHIALEGADQQLTYRQASEAARRLARTLRSSGIGPEKIVAICMDRSTDMIVSVLAVWMAGGAYMPLDLSQPSARLDFLVADAKPQLILSTMKYQGLVSRFGLACVFCDQKPISEPQLDDREPASEPQNLAYVIYTSGSTGVPKGVMVEHRALADHLRWMQDQFPLSAADRGVFKYSFNFDVSLVEMFWPLLAGARVIVPDGDTATDVNRLAHVIRDRGVTLLDVVPSMLSALLDSAEFGSNRSLRRVFCGGETMPPDLLNRLLERMDVEFCNMYGPTETTITATYWHCAERKHTERIPIGRPAGHVSTYVLDQYLNPLPPLVPGELYIGGKCLARGYLARPELTRERFVRDPFAGDPFARMYRTGDKCRFLPDGNIDFLGRVDDQIKIRGYRIELGEVEAVLSSSPLVRSCAAAIREDAQGQNQLVAYVVPNTSEPELWPSVGEYFIYDELLYHAMTSDRVRTHAYRRAIEKTVRGKTVVDIGSGADLVLARMCLEAGAKRVYAIEMLDRAVERARRLAGELDAGEQLVIIHGDSREVELPEKVDLCVSELIGTIGSSEGVIDLLNDARRFLKPGGEMIPLRCVTWMAAVSLPDDLISAPQFSEVPRFYANQIFESCGRRFDVRVCVKNLPASALLSSAGVFEELSFQDPISREASTDVELTVQQSSRLDGFLLWINLSVDAEEHIDVLKSETSWLPVFLPVFSPGIEVQAGDTITAVCSRLIETGEFTPDYLIRGTITRKGQVIAEFDYGTRRNEVAYCANPFYQALLETDQARRPAADANAESLMSDWEQLFEDLYADPELQGADPQFNIVGWRNSYTEQPLSVAEMHEQVEGTIERIRDLGGRRILEIGCGTGLLFRLAEHCERYVATDFSPSVIATLKRECERRGLRQVELLERRADDFSGIDAGSFDVVVLHSIVQYFPGMAYLVEVLAAAVRALRPGGSLFVGDVRSLPLLRWLLAGVELARANQETTAHELRERIERRLRQEDEMLIEPGFFAAWAAAEPAIGDVQLEVRRGWYHNELTKFRYDVVLTVGAANRQVLEWQERSWQELGSPAALAAYLRQQRPAALRLRNVPSARLAAERRLLELLERGDANLTVEELRREVAQAAEQGVEPEALWGLEHDSNYTVRVGWSQAGDDGCHEVWCVAKGCQTESRWAWSVPAEATPEQKPWSAYANQVLGQATQQQLAQQLRTYLRERLPQYMVPAQFVWLERLPLTPNGKLNRRALPPPGQQRQEQTGAYIAPRGPLKEQIAAIWSQVLGVKQISAEAKFFDLGGHSLLATQVVSRLSEALQLEIPLTLMFERPTISGLAEVIEALRATAMGTPSKQLQL
jgi:amino acid adenylation domain-containing protein